MLSAFESLVWATRTGVKRDICYRFICKFHSGGDASSQLGGGGGAAELEGELTLLGAYDFSLMERCGAQRLDTVQLSMLLACCLLDDDDDNADAAPRLFSDAELARLVVTVERLWCDLIAGRRVDDNSLQYRQWRHFLLIK